MIRVLIILTFVFVFSVGCSEPRSLVGPGLVADPNIGTSVFPHPEGWDEPDSHGIFVQNSGRNVCLGCHAIEGDPKDSVASCRSCHDIYPHQDKWVEAQTHGSWVRDNGTSKCSTKCHGVDFSGGLSQVSCLKCHETYPHPLEWSDVSSHGDKAIGDGKKICTSCHGGDYAGGTSGTSCRSCHDIYPHGDKWVEAQTHGSWVKVNGTSKCSTKCHGGDFSGGLSGVSCLKCHETYPHPSGWADISLHGDKAIGDGKKDCTGCHGTDYKGGTSGVSCYKCHEEYPHQSDTWGTYDGHAKRVLTELKGDLSSCMACHGTDLTGAGTGTSCYSCHKTYPHGDNWRDPSKHGVAAYGNGKTDCQKLHCHGSDFKGDSETGAPSCFDSTCHPEFPHIAPDWATGSPPSHAGEFIAKVQTGKEIVCNKCHGLDYDKPLPDKSCTSCHKNGVTHRVNWAGGTGHGVYYSGLYNSESSEANCKTCHDDPLAAYFHTFLTISVLERLFFCYDCHWVYPHIGFSDNGSPTNNYKWLNPGEPTNSGHIEFLTSGASLFIAENGNKPRGFNDSCTLIGGTAGCPRGAIPNTCGGGTAGLCHFNGTRSRNHSFSSVLCSGYCHK